MAQHRFCMSGNNRGIMAEAIAEVMRHHFRVWAGGPKPPASARPAIGGRFAPAGAGTGLWHHC